MDHTNQSELVATTDIVVLCMIDPPLQVNGTVAGIAGQVNPPTPVPVICILAIFIPAGEVTAIVVLVIVVLFASVGALMTTIGGNFTVVVEVCPTLSTAVTTTVCVAEVMSVGL